MHHVRHGSARVLRAAAGGTIVALAVAAVVAVPALSASRPAATTPVAARSDYLALGDSVSFGYRESTTTPAPTYPVAASFVGYPELVGQALDLHVANAACPGETSKSLLAAKVPSNGCENSVGGGPGYRSAYPLHPVGCRGEVGC